MTVYCALTAFIMLSTAASCYRDQKSPTWVFGACLGLGVWGTYQTLALLASHLTCTS